MKFLQLWQERLQWSEFPNLSTPGEAKTLERGETSQWGQVAELFPLVERKGLERGETSQRG